MTSGVLVIDKPGGITSHQVVARVRRALGIRKVGHAGTLDPMATGVLVVGVGRATRLLGYLSATTKQYQATIRLGQATITDDAEGETTSNLGAVGLDRERVVAAMQRFVGEIDQVPSAVSAVKINGVRSYARVRAGEAVELAARQVRIDRYELLSSRQVSVDGTEYCDLDVEVDCSSGTYIRALARDLGEALACGGHLTRLRRSRVGSFTLADAVELAAVDPEHLIAPVAVARRHFPVLELDSEQSQAVRYGRALPIQITELTAMIDPPDQLLALYRPAGERAKPEVVFVG